MNIIALGIGFGRDVRVEELTELARSAIRDGNIPSIDCVATLDTKKGEPILSALAEKFGVPIRYFSAETLKCETGVVRPSGRVRDAVGTPSVAEAAALAAAGAGASLIVTKRKGSHCTAAIAASTSRTIESDPA